MAMSSPIITWSPGVRESTRPPRCALPTPSEGDESWTDSQSMSFCLSASEAVRRSSSTATSAGGRLVRDLGRMHRRTRGVK